jgi:hypothetical protein
MSVEYGLFLTADWTDPSGLFEANTKVKNPDHRFWKRADDTGDKTNADFKTPEFEYDDSLVVGVHLDNDPDLAAGLAPAKITLNVVCALAKTQPAGSTPSMASALQDAGGNMVCLISQDATNPQNIDITPANPTGVEYLGTDASTLGQDTFNTGHPSRYEISVVATISSVKDGITRQYSYDPDMDVDN